MNAVEHARAPFQVSVEVAHGSLRVEVTDSGGGTPAARLLPDAASLRGRGLFIVDRLSAAWGTNPPGSASSVWFMITLDAAAGSADRRLASIEGAPPADRQASPPARRLPDLRTRPSQPDCRRRSSASPSALPRPPGCSRAARATSRPRGNWSSGRDSSPAAQRGPAPNDGGAVPGLLPQNPNRHIERTRLALAPPQRPAIGTTASRCVPGHQGARRHA
jgi:hypothetical protein